MDIEYYRRYVNRPTSLMGYPIVYCVPDELDEVITEICQKNPELPAKLVAYGGYTYIGVSQLLTEKENHADTREDTKDRIS